jgi:RNA polymerase-binding protein DksA
MLIEKRKYVQDNVDRLKDILQSMESELSETDRYSFHIADEGSDSMDREQSFMLLSRALKYLNQIDAALRSIEAGTYGICKVCGTELSLDRLEAVPTTTICVKCKNMKPKADPDE